MSRKPRTSRCIVPAATQEETSVEDEVARLSESATQASRNAAAIKQNVKIMYSRQSRDNTILTADDVRSITNDFDRATYHMDKDLKDLRLLATPMRNATEMYDLAGNLTQLAVELFHDDDLLKDQLNLGKSGFVSLQQFERLLRSGLVEHKRDRTKSKVVAASNAIASLRVDDGKVDIGEFMDFLALAVHPDIGAQKAAAASHGFESTRARAEQSIDTLHNMNRWVKDNLMAAFQPSRRSRSARPQ